MANKYAVKAHSLEELISQCHCVPYFMYWDTTRSKYVRRQNNTLHTYLWYTSFSIDISGVIILCLTLFLERKTSHAETFPLLSCGAWSFFILLGCLALGVNLVLLEFCDDFVDALNQLIVYGKIIESKEGKFKPPKKITRIPSKADMVGLFALGNVAFLHFVPFVLVPFGLALHPQMDPMHWIFQQILGTNYPTTLPTYLWYSVFTIRFIFCFLFCSDVLRTVSRMCNIMLLESPIFYLCLNHYQRFPLDFPVLEEYIHLCRIRLIVAKGCGELTSVAMGVCYWMMTITNAVCFFGWGLVSPAVFSCLAGAAVIQNGVTHTTLPMVAKLFDLSSGIIEVWKIQVNRINGSGKRKLVRKILKSLRPISFRCGSVGTLKKETKRNYFQSLLDGFINVTMTLDEFLG